MTEQLFPHDGVKYPSGEQLRRAREIIRRAADEDYPRLSPDPDYGYDPVVGIVRLIRALGVEETDSMWWLLHLIEEMALSDCIRSSISDGYVEFFWDCVEEPQ